MILPELGVVDASNRSPKDFERMSYSMLVISENITVITSMLIQHRKTQVSRRLRTQLPPQRKRGRPRDPIISRGMGLLAKFRRKYPEEKPRQVWKRICLILIPGYAALSEVEQRAVREDLQARVKSRVDLIRSRRKRQRKNRS
jgi:hypothetical protein